MNYQDTIKNALDVVLDEVDQTQTIDSNLFDLYTDLRGEEFEYYLLRPYSYGTVPFNGLFEKPDSDHDLDGSSPKPKQQTAKKAVTTSKSVKKTKNTKK